MRSSLSSAYAANGRVEWIITMSCKLQGAIEAGKKNRVAEMSVKDLVLFEALLLAWTVTWMWELVMQCDR